MTTTMGATIYYTTDDSTPTDSTENHGIEGQSTATVTVSTNTILKAIAVKGGTKTGAVQAAYTISGDGGNGGGNGEDDGGDDDVDYGTHADMPADGDWIVIASLTDFVKIGKNEGFPLNGKYWQTDNITITQGDNFAPITAISDSDSNTDFKGIFNGNNYYIKAESLTFNSVFSIFGDATDAAFKNIHIEVQSRQRAQIRALPVS
jgi:hypothetical protein